MYLCYAFCNLFFIKKTMRFQNLLLISSCLFGLTQCLSYDFSHRVVQQGNLLPAHKIQRLHVGMSKEDAAILMGTSLLSPLFNNNRWDYVYTWRRGSGAQDVHHLTLYFSHNQLSRIERS